MSSTGEIGLRAIMPVIVQGKCINHGERICLAENDTISLCNIEMAILTEYSFHLLN